LSYSDAGGLAGPGAWLPLAAIEVSAPAGWEVRLIGEGVQMTWR
jgi:hypothetical protein